LRRSDLSRRPKSEKTTLAPGYLVD
jgi:hypothetical protein